MDVDLLRLAGAAVTLAAAGGAVLAITRWVRARWRRVSEFLDDWNGEPPRPGFPGRPGVPERLTVVEASLSAVDASVAMIRGEVTPNHGGSMKDALNRIDTRTRKTGDVLKRHIDWHTNRGDIDPTARVVLFRPEDQN